MVEMITHHDNGTRGSDDTVTNGAHAGWKKTFGANLKIAYLQTSEAQIYDQGQEIERL